MVRLLVVFVSREELNSVRLPEFLSVAETLGISVSCEALEDSEVYLQVEFPSVDAAQRICDRCVMVKGVFEVWASASSYDALVEALSKLPRFADSFRGKRFKYAVESFGRSHTREQQVKLMQRFESLDHGGAAVSLSAPDIVIW
eukprot:RCo042505